VTTYVFGAGASRHAGYPLASELGDALFNWVSRNRPEDYFLRVSLEKLKVLYPDLTDLEQILTELDECPENSRAASLTNVERASLAGNFRYSVPEFFNALRQPSAPLYDQLARERVRSDDVILTFNYDLASERALKQVGLWEISNGYGFSLGIQRIPVSRVKVLKLHGSTNWWGTLFGGFVAGFSQVGPCALPSRPVIFFQKDFEFLDYSNELSDPFCPRGSRAALHSALIMPTLNKRFFASTSSGGHEWEEFWADIWGQAELALSAAEKIIIIGYSMPAADQAARNLLLTKSNKEAAITLVCGGSSLAIREEFQLHGVKNVDVFKGLFDDFLASV
jgi:hypothetical protein